MTVTEVMVASVDRVFSCLILDGYGVMTVFSFPYTPSCEPRLSCGGSLFGQLQTERSRYLDTGGVHMACGERRATRTVHNRVAACVAAGGGIFENQLYAPINSN